MLKIVYPNCCGIDVHKTFVVAVVAITDDHNITQYHRRRFSTFTKGLRSLQKWLELYSCFDVCMESTGKYWIPVFNVLEESCNVCLAHPKYVKAIKGKKTDKKDAKWIADLFKHDLVANSFIPPLKIRQLRDLFRYRMKLSSILTSEKNRYQNCLTWSNLQIASVVSDVFGKSAQEIIQSVLDNPQDKPDIASMMRKNMKASVETLTDSMDGDITPEQANKLRVIKSHFDAVTFCQNNLDQMIKELGIEFEDQRKLIQTVPGFKNPLTALRVISEIGVDMTKFPTAGHLCSWAGLVPRNDESANKKHSTKITKGGRYIKPLLVEVANAVVRSKKNPEHRNKYLQLKKRRGHKKAIIAIARRLLVAIYHILLKQVAYDATLYHVPELKQANRKLTLKEAVRFAQSQGFQVI
ncbi:IS110 family transposase [Limosilactobacillus reuteri]|uniref:IS110 family transposase n=1 Tax=Limosilactobacillus reuteri TaxID=1598 RepID=A0A517D5Y3_LIMRT|nr:IS110 family transposase [Limosilactobacillus reuteri]QDR72773.1 IS110 family transposase [Limosilactobacillus reuteri]